jgi:hypothetical protein
MNFQIVTYGAAIGSQTGSDEATTDDGASAHPGSPRATLVSKWRGTWDGRAGRRGHGKDGAWLWLGHEKNKI